MSSDRALNPAPGGHDSENAPLDGGLDALARVFHARAHEAHEEHEEPPNPWENREAFKEACHAHDLKAAMEAIARGANPLERAHNGDSLALANALSSAQKERGARFHALIPALLPLCVPPEPEAISASALIAAKLIGRPDWARQWLPRCDPSAPLWDGRSGLCKALDFKQEDLAIELLGPLGPLLQNADPQRQELARSAASKALRLASELGFSRFCAQAAALGDLLGPWKSEANPLLAAASRDRHQAIIALLPFYDPEREPSDQLELIQALATAASEGFAMLVKTLAPLVPPGARESGRTALMRAAARSRPECVKALLPFSDPLLMDEHGRRALALAAMGGEKPELREASAECVALLAPLSPINALDDEDQSAALLAIKANNGRALQALIDAGADLSPFPSGATPLSLAAERGAVDCARVLMPHSDPNAPAASHNSQSLFHTRASASALALEKRHFLCLAAMLPRLDLFTRVGELSLLGHALSMSPSDQIDAFLTQALAQSPRSHWPKDCTEEFFYALVHGRADWIDALGPRARWDFNTAEKGSTLLMAAAHGAPGQLEAALLHCDPQSSSSNGMSALMWAAIRGHEPAVARLAPLSHPGQLNFKGESALSLAIAAGHAACARLLLPPPPGWTLPDGKSLFHIAARTGDAAMIQLLAPWAQPWDQEIDLRGRDLLDAVLHTLPDRSQANAQTRWALAQSRLLALFAAACPKPDSAQALEMPRRLREGMKGAISIEEAEAFLSAAFERSQLSQSAAAPRHPGSPANSRQRL